MARLTKKQREENLERAERGHRVLEFYGSLPGMDPDETLTDLLADLMHYAREEKDVFFQRSLDLAEMHFSAETKGEP